MVYSPKMYINYTATMFLSTVKMRASIQKTNNTTNLQDKLLLWIPACQVKLSYLEGKKFKLTQYLLKTRIMDGLMDGFNVKLRFKIFKLTDNLLTTYIMDGLIMGGFDEKLLFKTLIQYDGFYQDQYMNNIHKQF